MKRLLLTLAVVSWAAPGAAQTSLLPTLERLRAEYPTPMSPAQLGEYLNRVAWEHRAEGWGLLEKGGGNRCPAPQGVDVSCDMLIHAPSIHHFDVLADSEGAAIPVWRDVGPCVIGPSSGCDMSNYLAPIGPPQHGLGDVPVPADYDGDAQQDVAVYRTSTGEWFILGSVAGSPYFRFGSAGSDGLEDIPVPADFDGDGRADLVIYRAWTGQWFVSGSLGEPVEVHFGAPSATGFGDLPVPDDYDKDGRADFAIYRRSTGQWFISRSSDGQLVTYNWGSP